MRILLHALSHALTCDQQRTEVHDADILIEGSTIAEFGKGLDNQRVDQLIDGHRLIAFPGLINAHSVPPARQATTAPACSVSCSWPPLLTAPPIPTSRRGGRRLGTG
jgi:cytosine/adenosine deaminase-related metal-dependent hydrolase